MFLPFTKRFLAGDILRAQDLHSLVEWIRKVGMHFNVNTRKLHFWAGSVLHAKQLNDILDIIDQIRRNAGLRKWAWSFGRFKERQILKAEHLNEIIECVLDIQSSAG